MARMIADRVASRTRSGLCRARDTVDGETPLAEQFQQGASEVSSPRKQICVFLIPQKENRAPSGYETGNLSGQGFPARDRQIKSDVTPTGRIRHTSVIRPLALGSCGFTSRSDTMYSNSLQSGRREAAGT